MSVENVECGVSVGVPRFAKGAPNSKGWLNSDCVCGGEESCGLEV